MQEVMKVRPLPLEENLETFATDAAKGLLRGCTSVVFPYDWWQETTEKYSDKLKSLIAAFELQGYVLGPVDEAGVSFLALKEW